MSNEFNNRDKILKGALLKIKELKKKLEQKEEPIAIIGMACRFPGGISNVQRLWDVLEKGQCMICKKPKNRWKEYDQEILNNPYVQKAGFLNEDLTIFDNKLFRISPKEAGYIDLQQRLFMEVCWEAFENAGYAPDSLKESRTGVFGGITSRDYVNKPSEQSDDNKYDPMDITGTYFSFLTGRVSHYFGLQGPSITVDTACSSSLVTVYEACQSLQNGDCDMALAGGVNIMNSPETTILLSKLNILSKECKLRSFDDSANGTVRGEGCGIVVLKRLSDAKEMHDNILAVINGGAINQDGPSSSLTAPYGPSQEKLLKYAWNKSGIQSDDISYIEVHGTGTKIGDPIEVNSIENVINSKRKEPLYLGTIKTNIGHLEAASGIAALIKVVLMVNKKKIPGNPNFETASTYIDWEKAPIEIPKSSIKWENKNDKPMICGVTSLGLSGTNAHLVVSEYKNDNKNISEKKVEGRYPIKFSATSQKMLKIQLEAMLSYLAKQDNYYNIACSYNKSKANLSERLAIFATNIQEAKENIIKVLGGEQSSDVAWGKDKKKCIFVFTGQGSQYPHMFEGLYLNNITFKKYMDKCNKYYSEITGESLLDIIFSDGKKINETCYTQPSVFSIEYSIAKTWMEYGIKPEMLLGHSIGEYVAACLAGVFSLEHAMKLIVARGRLMQYETPKGGMMAIYSNRDKVISIIGNNTDISIAASNSDSQTVISGKNESIEKIKELCQIENIKTKYLKVNKAFHSPLMKHMIESFKKVAESISYHVPKYKVISNITGCSAGRKMADWTYWCNHITAEVKFEKSIESIPEKHKYICIEMGANPVLSNFIQQITNGSMVCTYTNSSKIDVMEVQDKCAIDLYLHGIDINWERYYRDRKFILINTPNYIFEKKKVMNIENQEEDIVLKKEIHFKQKEDCKKYIENLVISELRIERGEISDTKSLLLLGANSIMVGRFIDIIQKELQINLKIKNFIANCNILNWTNFVWKEYKKGSCTSKKYDFQSYNLLQNEVFSLSKVQYAYWAGRNPEMKWGNVGCCAYFEFDIKDLNIQKFKFALSSMIERHDMLRCIITNDGQQKILKKIESPLIIYIKEKISDLSYHLQSVRNEMKYEVLPLEKTMFDIRLTEKDKKNWRIHFTIDFLIADAMSLFIFWDDFSKIYEGQKLQPLEITYKDYMYHTKKYLDQKKYEVDKTYWLNRAKDFPQSPELPIRNDVSCDSNSKFIRRKEILDKTIWKGFVRIAAKYNLTASAALLSIYSEVLSAWGGGKKFAIMLTVFKREAIHPQVEKIIGDFTRLMLVEVNRNQVSFGENAISIQSQMQNDLSHNSYSALEFVKKLKKDGVSDKGYPIVFTSALGIEKEERNTFLNSMEGIASSTPQVWLDHQIYKEKGGVALSWDILEEVFYPGVSEAMFESYVKLVKKAASDESFWEEIATDLRPDRQKIIQKKVNDTKKNITDSLLHEMFQKNVEKHPEAVALVFNDKEYSYEQLQKTANKISVVLQNKGVHLGDRVLIQMKKSFEQIAAVIAVVQIGAVYVPLVYNQSEKRTNDIVKKCSAKCIILDKYNCNICQNIVQISACEFLTLEKSEFIYDSLKVLPHMPGYIIYTSGSTGSPKGVYVSHKAAMNTILDVNERNKVTDKDKSIGISALNFDLSVYDIFGILSAGGTLILPSEDERIDPKEWLKLIKKYNVTLWNSVPALMKILVEYIAKNTNGNKILSLQHVFLSGDWIPLNLYRKVKDIFPEITFTSMGGATEASIWSNYYVVHGIESKWKSIPYGIPLANQQFYILDDFGKCCPEEVPGKLYIAGEGLALGYFNEPELTERAFIYNPRLKKRLYDTGDYGKYNELGIIEFLGRKDNQIKVNGYRIEKGEIIAGFEKCGINDEVIIISQGENMENKSLLAYIKTASKIDQKEIKMSLKKYLPAYLIPERIYAIDEIPITANGKINLALLSKINIIKEQTNIKEENIKSYNKEVLKVIKKVLGQEVIDINDSFGAIGVSSVNMIRLANELELKFKRRPSVKEMMTYVSIKELLEFYGEDQKICPHDFQLKSFEFINDFNNQNKLSEEDNQKAKDLIDAYHNLGIELSYKNEKIKFKAEKGKINQELIVKLKDNKRILMEYLKNKYDKKDTFPVTPIQRAYILGRDKQYELGNTSAHYYVELEWNNVQTEKLENAINIVIEKNEILRTIITEDAVQYVMDEIPYYNLPVEHYLDFHEFIKVREKWSHHVFQLGKWPMFYMQVSYVKGRKPILHFSFDCIIMDGWSAEMLLQEIYSAYIGKEILKPKMTFKEYILNEKQWMNDNDGYSNDEIYWKNKIKELPLAPQLPTLKKFSEIKVPKFKRLRFLLSKELTDKIKMNAKKYKFTLSAVICSAYMTAISQWTNNKEFTLNLTLFNRLPMHKDVEKILGDFTNIALIPFYNKNNSTFYEITKVVQNYLWEAVEHRNFDGMKVLRELSKNAFGKVVMPVVFTSMFFGKAEISMNNLFDETFELYGISQTPQVALDHQALIRNGRMVLIWDYIAELFDEEAIKTIFEKYCMCIDELAKNSDWDMTIDFE